MENTGFMTDHHWRVLTLWHIRQWNSVSTWWLTGEVQLGSDQPSIKGIYPFLIRRFLSQGQYISSCRPTIKAEKAPYFIYDSYMLTSILGNTSSLEMSLLLKGIYKSNPYTLFSSSAVRRPLLSSGYPSWVLHIEIHFPLSPSLFPQKPHEEPGVVSCTFIPNTRGQRQENPLGSLANPLSLIHQLQVNKRSYLKIPEGVLQSCLYACVYTHAGILVHTCDPECIHENI